jgi:signal transduction histidine kinase
LSALITLANCAVITATLRYSGGAESNLWVLFLLPIYTACMLLNGFEVALITLGVLCFNSAFYGFTSADWDATAVFSLAVKDGLFVFASTATWRLARRDRTNRRRLERQKRVLTELEEQFAAQQAELRQSEKMADVGQLTSGVAHDLNNPITVILGTANILLDEPGCLAYKRDLERILRSAELCRTIAVNLLNFAKDSEFRFVSSDIRDVVQSALSIYETTLRQCGIAIRTEFADKLPPVMVSPPHLHRVLLNLMSNARAAMKNGGTLTLRTEAGPRQAPGNPPSVTVAVEDSGPGLSDDTLRKLFKPFNTTKGPDGNGLGLYLGRQIMESHHGLLRAENRSEGGARFTLTLPASLSRAEAA